ncbi:M6 family metalloprotease domain-containing protein [Dactylosporangium sp. CS-033363]|uniref:M6 family metalloprotease domain-containing protein n=1 Tax=Dactylosporangium sp. CS-033363 TaxID=3239935 RepID=UPI003D90EBD4
MSRLVRRVAVAGGVAVVAAALLQGAGPAYADVPAGGCALPATGAALSEGIQNQGQFVPTSGTVAAKMIFVDFPDAPANGPTTALYQQVVPGGQQFFSTVSYGKLSLQVDADTSRFYRMPRASTAYGWQRGLTYEAHRQYIADALAAVGRSTSFRGDQLLYIVPTRAASAISFSPTFMGAITAGDGTSLGKTVTFGQDIWNAGWGLKVLAHETGHAMGLPDLYAFSGSDAHRFVGGWDLMGWIPGPSPDRFAWHKWKANWLAWDQVGCVTAPGRFTDTVTPVEQAGAGRKMTVIKTGATTVLVAEVRSRQGVDANACTTGVLIYSVDTAVASGNGPIRVKDARPGTTGCRQHPLDDAAYDAGMSYVDSATGVRIDVVSRSGDTYTFNIAYRV